MESYKIENLSFTYPGCKEKALNDISFKVYKGDFLCLCGRSGCGKTTLLRLLKSALSPCGEICGSIFFENKLLSNHDAKAQASKIGFVMQNPDNQIVCDKVWHELAFGLESLGFSTPEIRSRVAEMSSFFGIQNWFHKNVNELSGGQKQILNLASVMVMQPSVVILDEPASQLDPIAAQEFFNMLEKINRELGVTVIITEHRLEEVLPLSHRVVVMEKGKIVCDSSPRESGKILKELNHPMYMALPAPMRIYGAAEGGVEYPLTVSEGRRWLEAFSNKTGLNPDAVPPGTSACEALPVAVEIKDVFFRYEKEAPDVIKGLNMTVKKGELFAILGGNGTGKTTLLSLISALNTPYRGKVLINGTEVLKIPELYEKTIAFLPQNPQSLFVKKTVFNDLEEVLSHKKLSKEDIQNRIQNISELCGIECLLSIHPYDLSGGEQQRVALAKVLLKNPQILLLDEPTKGMDAHFKKKFAHILAALKEKGVTVIMVSHDVEFCAENADKCAFFFDGGITSCACPREFFAGKNFYTTSANRMARNYLPDAVLVSDVISACGKKEEEFSSDEKIPIENMIKEPSNTSEDFGVNNEKPIPEAFCRKKSGRNKRTLVSALLILFTIPLTIYLGTALFDDRKYYFISLMIILQTFLPFLMIFEDRKMQAREIVVISVLCAIAVGARTAFYMLPQFKPVIALVIISGICFGGETGFLVGSITGFVSNFFFGQGPWTPWQMFALGITGFLAGILFKNGFIKKTKTTLCIFGFGAAFVIYGGIMNTASVIMMQNTITLEMIFASFTAGLPFDLIHSLSTAFFLWVISQPMIDKLERIKTKYKLME